ARRSDTAPIGWAASLPLFHLGMWRERFLNALIEVSEGRPYSPPPEDIDEFNEAELARGIGTPLTYAGSRSDHLFGEILDVYQRVGHAPFQWYLARMTTEAVLRNSYTHPRMHVPAYLVENGDVEAAHRFLGEAAAG